MNNVLASLAPGSVEWARLLPAGFAVYASRGRWRTADHLELVQDRVLAMLGGEFDNLIVSMPPRHGKSEFLSKYLPAWYLGTFPHDPVIITSYAAGIASDWGGSVRDLLEEYGEEVFDLTVNQQKRAANNWALTGYDENGDPVTGGLRTAGVGGSLTGRGGRLIIIDDPVKNAAEAKSEVKRQAAFDWYVSTLFTRREKGAKQILVMTRWNEQDLAGRLVEHGKEEGQEWEVLSLPALCTDPEKDALGREEGEALWPSQWPEEELLKIRGSMTPYWFGALYQQTPAPDEGNLVKRAWWKFWKPPGLDLPPVVIDTLDEPRPCIELPSGFDRVISSWDVAFSKGKATSFVVGEAWAKKDANAFLLLSQSRARRNFPETVKEFRRFHSEEGSECRTKLVEDKANGPALRDQLQDEIPGIMPYPVKGSKEERARNQTPWISSGNVYLPHPAIAPWVHAYIDEWAAFPNGANDDQVDTTGQALDELFAAEAKKPSMLWGRRRRQRRKAP